MIDRPTSGVKKHLAGFPTQSFCLSGLLFNSWEQINTSLTLILLGPASFFLFYLPQGLYLVSSSVFTVTLVLLHRCWNTSTYRLENNHQLYHLALTFAWQWLFGQLKTKQGSLKLKSNNLPRKWV